MKHHFIIAISLIMLAVGCKTKQIAKTSHKRYTSAEKILQQHYSNLSCCEFLSGKVSSNKIPLALQFRFQKNKAIWLNAPFNMARIFVQPGKIQYYNKTDNSYLNSDFYALSRAAQLPLDFYQLQNILLGVIPYKLPENTDFEQDEHFYSFLHSNQKNSFTYKIGKDDFLLKQFIVTNNKTQKTILKGLFSHQKINDTSFINQLTIQYQDKNLQNQEIILQFKNINCRDSLSFPFEIPENYSPISVFEI